MGLTRIPMSLGGTAQSPLRSSEDSEPILSLDAATSGSAGIVKPDNVSLSVAPDGTLSQIVMFLATGVIQTALAPGSFHAGPIASNWNTAVYPAIGSPGQSTVLPRSFTITLVMIMTDTGPGGATNSTAFNVFLASQLYTPGTPLTQAGFTPLDSALNLTATGPQFLNSVITSFAAGPTITVPVNTCLQWQAVASGEASTVQVICNVVIVGHWN